MVMQFTWNICSSKRQTWMLSWIMHSAVLDQMKCTIIRRFKKLSCYQPINCYSQSIEIGQNQLICVGVFVYMHKKSHLIKFPQNNSHIFSRKLFCDDNVLFVDFKAIQMSTSSTTTNRNKKLCFSDLSCYISCKTKQQKQIGEKIDVFNHAANDKSIKIYWHAGWLTHTYTNTHH